MLITRRTGSPRLTEAQWRAFPLFQEFDFAHNHQTTPPVRRRWIYGVSRQTRMHTSIIYHQPNFLFYICYKFSSHHRSSTMGSFGFQYSDVVLNIEHIVADGISNGNAHGPSRNEFTSPFCFISIFTIRILLAIFSGSKYEIFFSRRTVIHLPTCLC